MSRANHTFMSLQAVQQSGPRIAEMDVQLGEAVTIWIHKSENATPDGVDAYLVGIHVDVDTLTFDVAVHLPGHPDTFVPIRNFLGRITRRGESYDGTPVEDAAPVRQRPQLKVVAINKDAQLAAEEAAADDAAQPSEPQAQIDADPCEPGQDPSAV